MLRTAARSAQVTAASRDAGSYALWGQDASPLYGATIAFGDSGRYTEVLPTSITSGSTEVGGILLCLSCHDGNVTASNMMTGQVLRAIDWTVDQHRLRKPADSDLAGQ